MHNFSCMGKACALYDLVVEIEVERPFTADHQLQEIDHIIAVHETGIGRHADRKIRLSYDGNASDFDGLVIFGALAVSPGGSCKVYDHRSAVHSLYGFRTK